MRRIPAVLTALVLLVCAGCGPAGEVTPTVTAGVPTETPTPTPEETPAPTEAPPEKSAFETELAKRLSKLRISTYDYGTPQFPPQSNNEINNMTAMFFYCVREQMEQLRDVDFSGFWDPETDPEAPGTCYIWSPTEDPGSFNDFLEAIRTYNQSGQPIGWANVSLDKLTGLDILDVTGYEGETVTGCAYGVISIIYPSEPYQKSTWTGWPIRHELTFVCRDRRWYICGIRFLGHSPIDGSGERWQ